MTRSTRMLATLGLALAAVLATAGAAQANGSTIARQAPAVVGYVYVPDLYGQFPQDAEQMLVDEGLQLGLTRTVPDSTCGLNLGLVVGQSPSAGTIVLQGTRVNVWVATTPLPVFCR